MKKNGHKNIILERRPLNKLKPFKRNPRIHSDSQVAQIAASIKQWGFTQPVLIDKRNMIIAGHGRVLAAKSLGLTEVPIVIVGDHWTEEQKAAYIIADNKLTENGVWDRELLKIEFEGLRIAGFDLALIGFAIPEIGEILGGVGDNPAEHWDGMPEFNQEAIAHRTILVHFNTDEDVAAFAALIGHKITEKTKFIWYPKMIIERYMDKRWSTAEKNDEA